MANKNFKARIGIEAPLIAADNGTTAITLTGANVAVAGDLTVTGTNISTGVTDSVIQIDKASSDTAISNRALKLLSTSTGTPTVGFGTALGFQGQTGVSTVKDAAYIAIASTDITASSEDFSMNFGLMQNGAAFSNKMTLNSAGDLTTIGNLDVQGGTITDSTGALTITSGATNTNITLAPNGSGKVISGVTQVADNSMVMGSLLATTNSSYTFPSIPITRVSGNNGLDVASSTVIGNGNLGNAAQQQLTHYSGDILAGQGSFASVVLRTANGNSVTGSTLPFTGTAQTAASGLITGDVMGALSFNGYATTDFTDFIGTRNQGGGFIGANSMQIQGLAAENFVNSTLTISGATITAVTRSSPGLSSVTVTGTRGQISFTATTPSVGQAVNVSGTNTGTSTGIVAGNYYIVAVSGTTGATLSATPGGVPITTTPGTTTGLTFARRWIVVTFTAQTYIPFGLNALVAVANITGVTNGTYMAWGSGTTTTVNIGVSTTAVSLPGTQSLSTPTVTNAGSALRIRSIPVATPLNSSNRIDIVDHRPSAAIYRADSFTFNTGAYGNTGTSLLTIDSSGNTVITGDVRVNGGDIQNPGGTSAITLTSANATTTIKGDAITLEDNAGTDYARFNSTSALFSKTVRTTITSASVAKGGTYTPAVTALNSIILEVTAGSGTTTIDVSNLTVAGENAVFDIMVYNTSGGSINGNALTIINGGITALDHGASIANGARAMFEVNCVDIYANAKYAGDAV